MVKNPADNAVIRKAMEAIASIDEEANKRKREQLAGLNAALATIKGRITELLHQEQQLLDAVAKITGKATEKKKRASKGGNEALREKVGLWISENGGKKLSAAEIRDEFPEIGGNVGTFLKPLLEAGTVKKEGEKVATRYMAG